MNIIEYVDGFIKTVVEFWRLRPREFVAAIRRAEQGYLSPYKFLVVFFTLAGVAWGASLTLHQAVLKAAAMTGESIQVPVDSLVVMIVVISLASVVVSSLCIRTISRFWPIRGQATFVEILNFEIYTLAIALPMVAVDVIVTPLLTLLEVLEIVPPWSIFVQIATLWLAALVCNIAKVMPGLAAVNGVSTARMWAGLLFWFFVLETVVIAVAISVALLEMV